MGDFFYDEFSFFEQNLDEWNLNVPIPHVRRFFVAVDGLRQLSGLAWGDGEPELVLLHGVGQNAHTFDTAALALQRPLISIDLASHGHSDAGPYGTSAISSHADDVARALDQLLDGPRPLVGMSLGGLTAIVMAHARPDLVSSLVLIDITPGVNARKSEQITTFINEPASFDSFDALLERTVTHNPTRSISSLRRGILHNAIQRSDGTWVWRHQRHRESGLEAPEVGDLWAMLGELKVPVTLLRGTTDQSVVDDGDIEELVARVPHATVVSVPGAGHSIQGDAPLELAKLLDRYCR